MAVAAGGAHETCCSWLSSTCRMSACRFFAQTMSDMFQSCRRHKKMSCRPGCPKRHDMSAVPDMSVISWLLFELKHKFSMLAKVPVCLGWFVLVGSNWYKLGVSGTLLCRNDTQCRPRFGDIDTCRRATCGAKVVEAEKVRVKVECNKERACCQGRKQRLREGSTCQTGHRS